MAINFEIGIRLSDAELKKQLSGVQSDLTRAFTVKNSDGGFAKQIAEAATQAKALEKALSAATTNKGISYAQLNLELAKAGTTAGKLTSTLASGGTYFRTSLDQANNALALSNRHVLSLNRTLQEAARVFKQSFKFTVAQTAIRAISTEIRESVQWVTNLNDAINNIAVVTGKTASQITTVTEQAIKGSQELRVAAEDYAKGALIFYQQGLNDEEVIRRNEITIKAAKAAGQSVDDMSKQLTAIWNTYGMVGDEQLRAASVGAKMAAQTAVDFSDIAQAMQTAAAPAAQMGVEYNQLAAIIATVGDATQQSASIIGNAYKTIFSRFQQLVSDGTDGEVTLGAVSAKLQNLGIQLYDSSGQLKELGQTINEVGQNWDNWSEEQQLAIAQLVGGTRQYGQFLALMQNFDKYQKNLSSAAAETGSTLEQQYNQVLDSIESRAENAGEAWSRAFSNLISADSIKGAYTALEKLGTAVDNMIQGLGGVPGILSIVAVLLSSKIVPALQVAGKSAMALGASLVGQQNATIRKDFDNNATKIEENQSLKQGDKETALAKNEFSRQTAIINEQINSQLSRATGLRKTELEMQQQQLKATQENFSATMSESQALEQNLQRRLDLSNAEGILEEESIASLQAQAEADEKRVTLLTQQLELLRQQRQEGNFKNGVVEGTNYTGDKRHEKKQNGEYISAKEQELASATKQANTSSAKAIAATDNQKKEEQSVKKLVAAYGTLQKALADYQKQKMAGKDDAAAKSMETAQKAASQLSKELGTVRDNTMMLDDEMQAYQRVLSGIGNDMNLEEVSAQLQGIGQEMLNMSTQGENAQSILSQTQQDTVRTATQLGEQTGNLARLQEEQAGAAKIAAEYQKATLSEGLSLTVQFASAAAMAANSIKNMWDIYNNPDLSGGEKALQIMTALSSMIMFTLPSLTSIISKVQDFGRAAIATATAESAAKVAGTTAEAAAEAGLAKAKEATGFAALKAGLMAQTAWGPLLPVILAITAAVAALIATFAFFASEASNTSAEGQLKKAEAAAEALAEAESEAKDKADNLRSAIESYDSAIDTLNSCTKGTKEWEEALIEVNKQASELLKKFPELLKEQDLFNQDGTLNSDVLTRAQTQADNVATAASAASLMGQVNVANKQAAVNTQKVSGQYYSSYTDANGYTYTENRGHTDGTAPTVSADLQKVLQQYDNVGSKALELSDIYSILGNVTDEYAEDVLKLAQTHVDAAQMMENANKLIINEWATNNNEELATGQAELMAAQQQEYYDTFADAFKEASNQNMKAHNVDHSTLGSAFDGTSFEGMSVTEAFNAARGATYSLAGNGVRGTDTNRSYVYLENGEEKEYKMEEMQATVAAAAALEMMGQTAQGAADTLANLKAKAGDEIGTGIQNYLATGDLESMNGKDFASLQDAVGDDAGAYLRDVLGKTDDELKQMLGEDYAADFQTAIDNYATAFDNFKSGLYDVVQKGFDSLDDDTDSLNVEGQKAMAQAMQDAYIKAGTEGLDTVQQAFDALDGDNIQSFVNVVDGMDWSTQGPEEFIAALEAAGVETDLTAEQLTNFAKVMSQQDIGTAFDSLNEQYASLQKTIGSLSTGDTISAEDFDSLSDPMKEYFTMMEDGTYALVGDAEKLQSLLKGENQKNRLDQISQLKSETNQTKSRVDGGQALMDKYGEGLTQSTYNADDNTYNSTMLKGQLDLLKEYQTELGLSDEKLNEWYRDLNDGSGYFENGAAGLAEIARYAQEAATAMEADNAALTSNAELMTQMQSAYLATAESVYELDMLYQQLSQEMGDMGVNSSVYNEALINMASNYDNTTAEIEQLRDAMASVEFDSAGNLTKASQEALDAAQDALKAATLIGEASEKYGLDARSVEVQAKALAKAYKEAHNGAEMSAESAARLAVANQRMNKGISTLNSNFKGWKKTLETCEKTSQDYADAVVGITDAIADLVGAEDEFELPDGFLEAPENLALIEQASAGSESAINQLGNMMAQAQVSAWEFNESLVNSAAAAGMLSDGFDATKFEEYKGIVMEGIQALEGELDNLAAGQDVGNILGENWVDSLNEMAIATGMSVEDMNALLNKLGVQAEVTTTSVPQQMEVPTYTEVVEPQPVTRTESNGEGGSTPVTRYSWKHYTIPGPPEPVEGYVQVAQIKSEGNDEVSGTPKVTWTGTSGRSSAGHSPSASTGGSKGGGSGSDKGKDYVNDAKVKKEKPEENRYANIDSAISSLTTTIEKLNDAENDAWGATKIRNLKAINYEIAKQNQLLTMRLKEAKAYYDSDWAELVTNSTINAAGYNASNISRNKDGSINNIEQIKAAIWQNTIGAAQAYENSLIGSTDEDAVKAAQSASEDAQEAYDEAMEVLDHLADSVQQYKDTLQEMVDNIRTMISNISAEISERLEFRIRIRERDLRRLEKLVDRWGETGILNGEADKYLVKQLDSITGKMSDTVKEIKYLDDHLVLLDEAKEQGKGSAAYEKILNYMTANMAAEEREFFTKAYDEWIGGNAALPAEFADALLEMRDSLEEYYNDFIDNQLQQLDNIFTRVNNFLDETFSKWENILDLNDAVLDFTDSLLEYAGFYEANDLRLQETARLQNVARMDAAQSKLDTSITKHNAYGIAIEDGEKALKYIKKYVNEFADLNGDEIKAKAEELGVSMDSAMETAIEMITNFGAGAEDMMTLQINEWRQAQTELVTEIVENEAELLQVAQENIEKEKELAKKNIGTILNGLFTDLEDLADNYSRVKAEKDLTFDDYDQKYMTNKLQNMYDEYAENADVESLEQLVKWQEKLNMYKGEWVSYDEAGNEIIHERLDMTQNEYDLLEKEFELAKLKADWEEAQNNKATMRLARDASGNYSYIYSSDNSSNSNDMLQQIADTEYEYKKLLESIQDDTMNTTASIALELQETIDGINQYLWEHDEVYRTSIQTKISSLVKQLQSYGASSERIFQNLSVGVGSFDNVWTNSAGHIVTGADNLTEHIKNMTTALVGDGDMTEPSSTSYLGKILSAYEYWGTTANAKLQESMKNLADEKVKGSIPDSFGDIGEKVLSVIETKIGNVNAQTSAYGVFKKNTEDLQSQINLLLNGDADKGGLGSVYGAYQNLYSYLNGEMIKIGDAHNTILFAKIKQFIGEPDEENDSTVLGRIKMLKNDMGNLVNDTDSKLKQITKQFETWSTQVCTSIGAVITEISAYIAKINELENTNAPDDPGVAWEYPEGIEDVGPSVDPGIVNPTPTYPTGPTGPTTPTTPTTPTYTDQEIAHGIGAAIWLHGNASGWRPSAGADWRPRVREAYGDAMVQAVWDSIKSWGYTGKYYSEYYVGPGNAHTAYSDGTVFYRDSNTGKIRGVYTGGLVTEQGIYELAEKGPEIVLNAEDTKNILAAVAMMRQTVAGQLGSLNGALGAQLQGYNSTIASYAASQQQPIDQQVKIEASFPGVSVAQEIEDALNSLITQAAQYNIKK